MLISSLVQALHGRTNTGLPIDLNGFQYMPYVPLFMKALADQ